MGLKLLALFAHTLLNVTKGVGVLKFSVIARVCLCTVFVSCTSRMGEVILEGTGKDNFICRVTKNRNMYQCVSLDSVSMP